MPVPVCASAKDSATPEKEAAAAARWMIWRRDNHSQFQIPIPSFALTFMAIGQKFSFSPNCISRGSAAEVITPKVADGIVQVSGPTNWV